MNESKLIVQVPVSDDGSIDLPVGAHVISIEFEDEGGLGNQRRPAVAWVVMPAP